MMGETLEEILARKTGGGSESVEDILARSKKVTYPFEQPQTTPSPESLGFTRVGPGRMQYGEPQPKLSDMQELVKIAKGAATFTSNAILPIAGLELGGSLVPKALAEARPLANIAIKAGMRALGAGAGGEAATMVGGEKPSLRRGLRTARNVALTEGMVRGSGYMLGRAGGVEPVAASAAQDRPGLLKPAPAKEYAAAGKDIAQTYNTIPETAEHAAYRNLVTNRGTVDGMPYVQEMLNTVRQNVDEPVSRLIESKTTGLADKLFQRLGPNGEINAVELDDWIRKNLREPAARVYEKGAGAAWQERLAGLNDKLSPKLYADVGGGAPELQAATSKTLGKVEAAKKMFPEQTPGRPNIQTPAYLRQVLNDTDVGEQVRTRLSGLDEVAGTNHLQRVKDLSMRSSWTAQEKSEVADILANIPSIRMERVGLVRAGARGIGRKLTRIVKPSGRVATIASTVQGTSQ